MTGKLNWNWRERQPQWPGFPCCVNLVTGCHSTDFSRNFDCLAEMPNSNCSLKPPGSDLPQPLVVTKFDWSATVSVALRLENASETLALQSQVVSLRFQIRPPISH